ncbi:MAG TPA: hypothetical protein DDW52_29530 [Planctomycetaceae bacterium]|nr:hypothetical protein [Planctomycetaceae bacterium]
MPRSRYSITADDVLHVTEYLTNQLHDHRLDACEDEESYEQFEEAIHTPGGKKKRAEALNAWCEAFLNRNEWKRLNTNVRKRRQRYLRHNDYATLTVSARSHELLQQLSARDNVTFSDILEHCLSKAVKSSRKIPRSR